MQQEVSFKNTILCKTKVNKDNSIDNFISGIPKAELHLHIEGTFEPELMFKIARRNNINIRFNTIDELKKAYNFNSLQDFLNIYYEGANVLITEQDFFDLTWAYIEKIHSQNVLHTEIFFDPQTHTERGIEFSTIITGIHKALTDAKIKYGISSHLIMSFLRHLDAASALNTLESSIPFREWIKAVGLDSSEVGNPPSKFREVFDKARSLRFLTVAHAGEEGPPEYVREALDYLKVSRIDHGNNSLKDEKLVEELIRLKIPLTICPLSNLKLRVVKKLEDHPLKTMLEKGLLVTVNSDDPAYFGGYLNENYLSLARSLNLSKDDIGLLAKNSFTASFLESEEKDSLFKILELYISNNR
jgi:adenosine deaminase